MHTDQVFFCCLEKINSKMTTLKKTSSQQTASISVIFFYGLRLTSIRYLPLANLSVIENNFSTLAMNLNNFSFKNYVLLVATFLCFIQDSEQLYEDQIGKFDW